MQVPNHVSSLNSNGVFVLDAGLKLYQWNGSKISPKEKKRGLLVIRMLGEFRGKVDLIIVEEADQSITSKPCWDRLGGEGPQS